jgi:hypothetical protein
MITHGDRHIAFRNRQSIATVRSYQPKAIDGHRFGVISEPTTSHNVPKAIAESQSIPNTSLKI